MKVGLAKLRALGSKMSQVVKETLIMKKILLAMMLMIPVLSGCLVVIDDIPNSKVTISNAKMSTNWLNTATGEYVICDDRDTTITYSFNFTGNLTTWETYLQGPTEIKGRASFTLSSKGVSYDPATRFVEVNAYLIKAGAAPQVIEPQITVNRKNTLYLNINGSPVSFYKDITVLNTCDL
jgi:hypothetical protein